MGVAKNKCQVPHRRKARSICRICHADKMDRNKLIKNTVEIFDIFYSHFHEAFYFQTDAYLTSLRYITFHGTKTKHFTQTNIDHNVNYNGSKENLDHLLRSETNCFSLYILCAI